MYYTRSSELFKEAKKVLVGGVNSPVRAFNAVGGTPIFIKKAKGAYLYDEDNNKYIDYISSWGALIFGHSYKPILKEIIQKVKKGTSFGAPTEIEIKAAAQLVSNVPNIEKVRFVNSGTEACMSAIRLARGVTGRSKIVKFRGCYHGHADAFLIQSGSGAATFGVPNSPGVTQDTAKDTLLADYNDIDSVRALFEKYKKEIAGIILEPVAGNMGCIPPQKGFLQELRTLCDDFGSLLIFDEVMTGFRIALGGAQEYFNVKADIVTYGKIIGGGLPVGAFASTNDIMSHLAPEGKVYQAGTLSGNPVAMAATLKTMTLLKEDTDIYTRLNNKTKKLYDGMKSVLAQKKIKYQINQLGSMISLHFSDKPIRNFQDALASDNTFFNTYFHKMLAQGIYLPPSAFESYFLNDSISEKDIVKTVEALERAM